MPMNRYPFLHYIFTTLQTHTQNLKPDDEGNTRETLFTALQDIIIIRVDLMGWAGAGDSHHGFISNQLITL